MNEGLVSARLGLKGIPSEAEEIMAIRDILLARRTGGHVHLCHMSTRGSVDLIRWGKDRGINVTAEVCPHHLFFNVDDYERLGSLVQMNPSIKTAADNEGLWRALKDGLIQVIATDHAPHAPEEKDVPFEAAPFGVTGLETSFAALYTYLIEPGVLRLETVLERMSAGPASIFGLERPRIVVGAQANLTLIDTDASWRVKVERFQSRSQNSWLLGKRLRSRIRMTIAAGRVVHEL